MEDKAESERRLPGPIGLYCETKVTSIPKSPSANKGGIGEASGPTLETPRKAKEIRVRGPKTWMISGFILLLFGIVLLEPIIIGGGLCVFIVAIFTKYRNNTESRLRISFEDESSQP